MSRLRDLLTKRPALPEVEKAKNVKLTKSGDLGDSDSEQNEAGILSASKKIEKFNRNDYKECELTHIGYPSLRGPSDQCKKLYSIPIQFRKKGEKSIKTRQVLFGSEGNKDFVDHKNEEKRLTTCKKLTNNDDNWAHPNHYRLFLLNSVHDNMQDAHAALVKAHGLDIDSKRAAYKESVSK